MYIIFSADLEMNLIGWRDFFNVRLQ